ncbi:hypothetical protein FJZ31_33100 [Candidatus Poribacteria bacterium]|nr:hypothetical protein [Candidatus Poribacteria bacterium]
MNKRPLQGEFRYMYGVLDRPIIFIIGLLIAGIAGNLIYELAHDLPQYKTLWRTWGIEVVTICALIVAAYLVNRLHYERKLAREREEQMRVLRPRKEEGLKHSYRGIIWLLSPDKDSLPIAQYAIGKQKFGLGSEEPGRGKLEVCWCIYGAEKDDVKEELDERMKELKAKLKELGINIKIEGYPIERPDAQLTFDAVKNIYHSKIQKHGLKSHEVMADITGGFASMSAGMVVACFLLGLPVEYIQVQYISSGGNMVRSSKQENWNHILIDLRESISAAKGEAS